MNFEGMSRQENNPKSHAVERIEQGDLGEEELRTLATLKTKALRYGLGLYFHDTDEQSGQVLSVHENLAKQKHTMTIWEQRFQEVAKEEALKKLSPEKREEYEKLVGMSPDQLETAGESWRDPASILEVPDVRTMDMEDLENIIDIFDLQVADMEVTGDLKGLHREELAQIEGNVDAEMDKTGEFMANMRNTSRNFREAMALQMERPGVISASLDMDSNEYLETVKTKLGISQ